MHGMITITIEHLHLSIGGGLKTVEAAECGPKIETEGRERGWGFGDGSASSKPPPHQVGVWGVL